MSAIGAIDVISHRGFGWVRYACVSTHKREDRGELLGRLGLMLEGHPLRELDALAVVDLLAEIFSRGLAHKVRVTSAQRARTLAEGCVANLFPAGARFYTNVALSQLGDDPLSALIAVSAGHTFGVGVEQLVVASRPAFG